MGLLVVDVYHGIFLYAFRPVEEQTNVKGCIVRRSIFIYLQNFKEINNFLPLLLTRLK
jgi:hypothetical protein